MTKHLIVMTCAINLESRLLRAVIFFVFVNQFAEAKIILLRPKSSTPCYGTDLQCGTGIKATTISPRKPINPTRHTCIVGAGIAGMSTARHLIAAGENFTVFEASAHMGGLWRYDPHIGTDAHGRPVHSSMYKHLKTNAPKHLMELPGFPMPANTTEFPSSPEYYRYILHFAENFKLKKHIKFLHEVTSISRWHNGQWKLKHRNLISRKEFGESCDYVVLCNGHLNKPRMPNLSGEDVFKGTIIHSHDFRDTELYRNRRVLIVGAGLSGLDIGHLLSVNSTRLIHSHHAKNLGTIKFPDNYVLKPDVEEFTENGVRFKDGTFEEIDDVVPLVVALVSLCFILLSGQNLGYEENYPFLDESSGLSLVNGRMCPLYLDMLNINYPTMLILGIDAGAMYLDYQARYATSIITENVIPTISEIWKQCEEKKLQSDPGRHRRSFIQAGFNEDAHYEEITAQGGIAPMPPVLRALREAVMESARQNYMTFRDYKYIVLDDYNFTKLYRPDRDSD